MKHNIIITTAITLALTGQLVSAGSITDSYAIGDTLTAAKMDNIKNAVNDNNTKINAAGDITAVNTGSGLTGGGTSGSVTLSVGTGAITGSHIATDTITASDIAANGVGASEIATGAVGSSEIATNSVIATDMQNEPGIRYSTSSSTYDFTLTWQTVETLTMVLPSSGYVNCTAQGFIENVNSSSNNYNIFGWDHNNTAAGVTPDIQNWSNQSGTANVYTHITSMATFTVAAGTNTFSFKIRTQQGLETDRNFRERGYVCMFFPTQY